MYHSGYAQRKHCRWCGVEYYAKKPINRDGFCSAACKQAHHRSYKKYVTAVGQRTVQAR